MVKKIKTETYNSRFTGYDIDSGEIARGICSQASENFNYNDIENAIFDIIVMAENKYNSDYWKELVEALNDIFG